MQADRLYNLLPAVYRLRDAERGYPLQELLGVIDEQVAVVEDDIAQLYENWFIETCEDWVVPYLGDLLGWRQVHEAGEPGDLSAARARNKILIPRREMANTIRLRRRKGTLALLEVLAQDVAGWPARAVEFFKLIGRTQNLNLPHPERGRTLDLRDGAALDLINTPFDAAGHTASVRGARARGYSVPSVALFVSRLKSYSVGGATRGATGAGAPPRTYTPAFCVEEVGPHCFTFSVLGNDAPLFTRAERETDPHEIAGEINLPIAIRRRAFEERRVEGGRIVAHASERYYGENKSLAIFRRRDRKEDQWPPISAATILPADLSDWGFRTPRGRVAVDPALGRIVFPDTQFPKDGVWVFYHYGFSSDLGGGEYDRPLAQLPGAQIYRVGPGQQFTTINAALRHWQQQDEAQPQHAVIEITDSGVYVEQINVELKERQSLQLRAANRRRPVIRLLDYYTDRSDALSIKGARGSRFTLDGLLITGRSVTIEGEIAEVAIRHSTLVPGWAVDSECNPRRPTEPSLELRCPRARVEIEHSILGSIQVHPLTPMNNETTERHDDPPSAAAETGCGGVGYGFLRLDPICLSISDSILDATDPTEEALGAPGCPVAHARLTIRRCTVFGRVQVHAIDLGENSIFEGQIFVARRQQGCLRFCYVTPGSRTPRRYRCQPDLAAQGLTGAAQTAAETRVRPRFNSVRYGRPDYCQLADDCPPEITRGADDESEMGVFHDLYQPQRAANLRARLDEYSPAGMDAGVIFIN